VRVSGPHRKHTARSHGESTTINPPLSSRASVASRKPAPSGDRESDRSRMGICGCSSRPSPLISEPERQRFICS
jgi:hypothetical protein